MTGNTRWRRALTATLGALTALAMLLGAAVLGGLPAQAAAGGITSVKITQPIDNVSVGESIRIDATWSADGMAAGDQFTMALPNPPFAGTPATFELRTAGGESVGTCVVTPTQMTCTLNDYVTTHTGVKGNLYFWATAEKESADGTADFVVDGGTTFEVAIPGGGVGPKESEGKPWPDRPFKDGAIRYNTHTIDWAVYAQGSALLDKAGNPLTITDTFDARLALTGPPVVYWVTAEQWVQPGQFGHDQYLSPSQYTIAPGANPNQFKITIDASAINKDRLYIIKYTTALPANASDGQTFTNSAATASWNTGAYARYSGAGGGGEGTPMRSVEIVKQVTGDAKAGPFTFELVCNDAQGAPVAGFPKQVQVPAGQKASFGSVPVGSVCQVAETDMGGAQSVTIDHEQFTLSGDTAAAFVITAINQFPDPVGSLAVTKSVTGDAAEQVAGMEYEVSYSVDVAGEITTGSFTVADGATHELTDLPIGAHVTLDEVTPVAEGVVFADPVWSVDGGEGQAGPVTYEITGTGQIAVALTNTVDAVPPPPVGSLAVTKAVTGDAAEQVAGMEYEVSYSVDVAGEVTTGSFTVADGATHELTDLPIGAHVTLDEVTPVAEGVVFADPVWSVDGGEGQAGPVTYEITGTGQIAVALTNAVSPEPVGSLAVTKAVTGDAAEQVAGMEFEVAYALDVDGQITTGSFMVAGGATYELTDLPIGAKVSLDEVTPSAEGVDFGQPLWSVDGALGQTGPVTYEITGTGQIAVQLINTAREVPAPVGSLAVTKDVTGDAADQVAGMEYEVTYSVDVAGEVSTGSFKVAAGAAHELTDLPIGAKVTLDEVTPVAEGVIWADPVWSVDGGEGQAGPVTYEITGTGQMAVTLTNTVDPKPTDPPTDPTDPPTEPTDPPTDPPTEPTDPPTDPPTEPTDPPTEPTDPTTEPTVSPAVPQEPKVQTPGDKPGTGQDSELAITGASTLGVVLGALGLIAAGGLTVLLVRRRTARR